MFEEFFKNEALTKKYINLAERCYLRKLQKLQETGKHK